MSLHIVLIVAGLVQYSNHGLAHNCTFSLLPNVFLHSNAWIKYSEQATTTKKLQSISMCPATIEPVVQMESWFGAVLSLWCALSYLPAGMRKLHRLIAAPDLRCMQGKSWRRVMQLLDSVSLVLYVVRLCVLIMSRTAFIWLQWDSLVKFPSSCIPKSLFNGNKSHFILPGSSLGNCRRTTDH